MTQHEKDCDGSYFNRLFADGSISGLEYLQAIGIPVYRLRVQLRMARGLFDAVARFMVIIYRAPFNPIWLL